MRDDLLKCTVAALLVAVPVLAARQMLRLSEATPAHVALRFVSRDDPQAAAGAAATLVVIERPDTPGHPVIVRLFPHVLAPRRASPVADRGASLAAPAGRTIGC